MKYFIDFKANNNYGLIDKIYCTNENNEKLCLTVNSIISNNYNVSYVKEINKLLTDLYNYCFNTSDSDIEFYYHSKNIFNYMDSTSKYINGGKSSLICDLIKYCAEWYNDRAAIPVVAEFNNKKYSFNTLGEAADMVINLGLTSSNRKQVIKHIKNAAVKSSEYYGYLWSRAEVN